jgi:putative transcription antitermination factor YqgF
MFWISASILLLVALIADAFFLSGPLQPTAFRITSKKIRDVSASSSTCLLLGQFASHILLEDDIQQAIAGPRTRGDFGNMANLVNIAAAATQESCSLLGVKSVGVDYGLVRTGIAATIGYNPSPLTTFVHLNNTQLAQEVISICRSEQAKKIVVGLPLHKNGTEAEQTNLTRIFANELAHLVVQRLGPNIPVYMWDERYTSKEAAARAHSKDPNQQLYGMLDAESACIILENFYNDNGKDAEVVQVSEEIREQYTKIWEENKLQEQEQLKTAQDDRASRQRWRQEAMEQDRLLEMENKANGESSSGEKKRKKKRKK